MSHRRIWVIDDDDAIRWVLERAFANAGFEVKSFSSASDCLRVLESDSPDALITDIRMPGMDGLELLEKVGELHPDLPVIVTTAHSDLESAVSAYQGGAFDYLPKPFDIDEAVALAERACESRVASAGTPADEDGSHSDIIGESPAMQEVFRAIGRLSHSHINVLINGSSGTGKELVAQALHKHSPRKDAPFIALNMAAIPRDLMESELFGHEKGAFTGAQSVRRGHFEHADGGTLFLDEIGDMPAEMQTRLLRVLSDGQFYRVGGHTPVKVNVRIIAATHQDLENRVKDGLFREDLFHRLNVIRVLLPPLNKRREDIPLLMDFFLKRTAEELGEELKTISPDVVEYLSLLDWPGNVRQLENACRWLTVMCSGREIKLQDLPSDLRTDDAGGSGAEASNSDNWQHNLESWADGRIANNEGQLIPAALPRFEEILIRVALKHTGGRRQDAAKLLGWGRNTLTRKIAELELDV